VERVNKNNGMARKIKKKGKMEANHNRKIGKKGDENHLNKKDKR
jgi:hypothetical protein